LLLNDINIGLQCNLQFLSTTVLQGRVATLVNDDGIFNDFFIANLLLSVTVKNFEDRLGFGKVMAKNKVAPFLRTRCISVTSSNVADVSSVFHLVLILLHGSAVVWTWRAIAHPTIWLTEP